MKKKICAILFILSLHSLMWAQNLVPNGNFEVYSQCPSYGLSQTTHQQIIYANGWFVSGGSPDYWNICSNGLNNSFGYQNDCCGGGGYVGIYTVVSINTPGDDIGREYAGIQMNDTLMPSHKYIASFYTNVANVCGYYIKTMSMFFSDTAIISSNPSQSGPLSLNPQVKNAILLNDTLNWILVQDTFRASGNEIYLTIGNFNTTVTSDTVKIVEPFGNGIAYHYIDGVSVYDITNSTCNIYWDAGYDKYIIQGDSIRLGAMNTDNSSYLWVNSINGATYLSNNSDARPWATPSITTTYYVTKTCTNNNVFTDTVTVYVQSTVGINQITDNTVQIKIYPNPAKNKIYIDEKNINEIDLFNLLGSKIISTKEQGVDVSGLNDGVYFITINSGKNTVTQKIIIQH